MSLKVNKYFSAFHQHVFMSVYLLENEVDGSTLELMGSVGKITTLIPKLKQQLIFLREREKLFKTNDNHPIQHVGSSSVLITNSNSSAISSTNPNLLSSPFESVSTQSSQPPMDEMAYHQSSIARDENVPFPDEYMMPPLPDGLMNDINSGALNKFGPHYSNRQILIDCVVHDLVHKYNLL